MLVSCLQIVKRSTESVIYRAHSQRFNKTMAARERRIARMKSMPEMKLDFIPEADKNEKKSSSSKLKPAMLLSTVDANLDIHGGARPKKRSVSFESSLSDRDNMEVTQREPLMKVEEEEQDEEEEEEQEVEEKDDFDIFTCRGLRGEFTEAIEV